MVYVIFQSSNWTVRAFLLVDYIKLLFGSYAIYNFMFHYINVMSRIISHQYIPEIIV